MFSSTVNTEYVYPRSALHTFLAIYCLLATLFYGYRNQEKSRKLVIEVSL